jgi:hypothetical protein
MEGEVMAIVTVGIDLAKNVFAVHGVDELGKPVLVRPEVPRAKLLELFANLSPCLIAVVGSTRSRGRYRRRAPTSERCKSYSVTVTYLRR